MANSFTIAIVVLVWAAMANAADTGGPLFRNLCTQITDPVTNKVLCWEQTPPVALKYWNGSAWVDLTGGSAPADATYLTLSLNGTLTQERVLTAGNSIVFTDTGANGTLTVKTAQDIQTSASPTWVAAVLTGASPSLTVGTASSLTGGISFLNSSNANYVRVTAGATSGNVTFKLPIADGTSGDCLTTDGAGQLSFAATCGGAAGGITSLNAQVGAIQTFANDTNVTITSAANTHTLGWTGTLGLARGGCHTDLSGTGGTGQYLKQSSAGADCTVGTIAASDLPGSFSGFANPTASVGLSAVNGAATTAMRSDAAPALSQAIVPTWTGAHIWQNTANSTAAVRVNQSAGTVVFDVDTTNARVGVGTATPQYDVHILATNPILAVVSTGGGNPTLRLQPSGAGVDPVIEFTNSAGTRTMTIDGNTSSGLISNVNTGLAHILRVNNVMRMTVDNDSVDVEMTIPMVVLQKSGVTSKATFLGAPGSGNIFDFQMSGNAYFDGANWQRFNVAGAAMNLGVEASVPRFEWRYAAAGANPITWTQIASLSNAGVFNALGGLTVNGVCVPTFTGSTGQIAWGNGTCTLGGATELTWDNTLKRATLATTQTNPSYANSRPLNITTSSTGARAATIDPPTTYTQVLQAISYPGVYVLNTDASTGPSSTLGYKQNVAGFFGTVETGAFDGSGTALAGAYFVNGTATGGGNQERVATSGSIFAQVAGNYQAYAVNGFAGRTAVNGSIISGLFEINNGTATSTGAYGVYIQNFDNPFSTAQIAEAALKIKTTTSTGGSTPAWNYAILLGPADPSVVESNAVWWVYNSGQTIIAGTPTQSFLGFYPHLAVGHTAAPANYIGLLSNVTTSQTTTDTAAVVAQMTVTGGTTGPAIGVDSTVYKSGGSATYSIIGYNLNMSSNVADTALNNVSVGMLINNDGVVGSQAIGTGLLITATAGFGTSSGHTYPIRVRAGNGNELFQVIDSGHVNARAGYQTNGNTGVGTSAVPRVLTVRASGGGSDCTITLMGGIVTSSTC